MDGLPADHPQFRKRTVPALRRPAALPTLDEALKRGNAVHYGLCAGFYGRDEEDLELFLDRAEAGVLYANRRSGATTGAWPGIQTFGGWKASGLTGKTASGRIICRCLCASRAGRSWTRNDDSGAPAATARSQLSDRRLRRGYSIRDATVKRYYRRVRRSGRVKSGPRSSCGDRRDAGPTTRIDYVHTVVFLLGTRGGTRRRPSPACAGRACRMSRLSAAAPKPRNRHSSLRGNRLSNGETFAVPA